MSQLKSGVADPLLKEKAMRLAVLCEGISAQIERTEDTATSLYRGVEEESVGKAGLSVEGGPQCLYSALSMVEHKLEIALQRLERVNSKFSSLV